MPFNVLTDPFLPVRTRDGGIRALTLTDLPDAQDALEPAWPRPDFNATAMELLVGIATLALQPRSEDAWADIWNDRPDGWADRLRDLAPAFELMGDGPRFLQENGGLTGQPVSVEALLIDTPGANGQKKNADLLTHRGRYLALSFPAAAMALYTLQAYAPAGGAGNQTSMRGGGPLSTLVIPQSADGAPEPSLWQKIWANVLPLRQPVADIATVCPWMSQGIASGKISQGDPRFHDLHALFGMPRRLWLVAAEGTCALTGAGGPVVTGFLQKPKGHDYHLWRHPLTPYRRQKDGGEPYTAKPSSARFRSADWIAAAIGDPPLRDRAEVVQAIGNRSEDLVPDWPEGQPTLRVSGWNMNNMEATDWLAAEEPLYVTGDPDQTEALAQLGRTLAYAAEEAAGITASNAKRALFGDGPADTGKGILAMARSDVLDRADARFHEIMGRALRGEEPGRLKEGWCKILRHAALAAFDLAAPVPVSDPQKARRVVAAHLNLRMAFTEKSKMKRLKALIGETVS